MGYVERLIYYYNGRLFGWDWSFVWEVRLLWVIFRCFIGISDFIEETSSIMNEDYSFYFCFSCLDRFYFISGFLIDIWLYMRCI